MNPVDSHSSRAERPLAARPRSGPERRATWGAHQLLSLVAFFLVCWPDVGRAAPIDEARTALIIGNSGYASSPLANPKNDARDLAKVLEGLGFEVDLRIDQSQRQMKIAIRSFREKLKR